MDFGTWCSDHWPAGTASITPMNPSYLIAVDWGTSTLRCVLMRDGAVLLNGPEGPGILAVPPNGFEPRLANETAAWRSEYGPIPIVLSGMVGSRQGWREVPYQACPADVRSLAGALCEVASLDGAPISIVPGLVDRGRDGHIDVMRGEETQIIGALSDNHEAPTTLVLPGTHSKWADVRDGVITGFRTFMTGEIFGALTHHTILGRLMPDKTSAFDGDAFERGVAHGAADGQPGALMHRVFSARTLALFEDLAPEAIHSYLSGVLIGAELVAGCASSETAPDGVSGFMIIGSSLLCDRYSRAARYLGLPARVAANDVAAMGAWRIAQLAGIMTGNR
jgi:2-dehydro-3-deoxygalactonokinase